MAVLTTRTMEEIDKARKPVFPLFQRSYKPPSQSQGHAGNDEISISSTQALDRHSVGELGQEYAQANPQPRIQAEGTGGEHATQSGGKVSDIEHRKDLVNIDPNNARRKRRRTESPEGGGKGLVESEQHKLDRTPLHTQTRLKDADVSLPYLTHTAAGHFDGQLNEAAHRQYNETLTESTFSANGHREGTTLLNKEILAGIESGRNGQKSDTALESSSSSKVDIKPKKVLKLNPRTGTIGSPPMKRTASSETSVRRAKSSRETRTKSKMVTFAYGPSHHLPQNVGLKIDRIMNSSKSELLTQAVTPPASAHVTCEIRRPPKAVHPLFLGKAAPRLSEAQKSESEAANVDSVAPNIPFSISEPLCNPKSASHERSRSPHRSLGEGTFRGGSKTSKLLKFPGAIEPAWPWKDMIHVRGYNHEAENKPSSGLHSFRRLSQSKKSKYSEIQISAKEDVINYLANDLDIDSILKSNKDIDPDQYPAPAHCLRTPQKRFESGIDIQRRLRKELHARVVENKFDDQSSSDDEISSLDPARARIHPALTKVYGLIATSLSAFDMGQCESHIWAHKYSPNSAAEVLQTGKEAIILKEWLQNLTVQSVEGTIDNGPGSRGSSQSRKLGASQLDRAGKRKRKPKKLDGFVVSSDDELNDMDEITDPQDNLPDTSGRHVVKRTLARAGDKGSKNSGRYNNSIVISGPHGSGKTSSVYAVAKELGFEVFEINASTKRSGKDIMERVGDMTRNHLVQRAPNEPSTETADEDSQRITAAIAKEIETGRQGTMNSFLKPQRSAKEKIKVNKLAASSKMSEGFQEHTLNKTHPKQQKQSLILIEEVDILYDEDRLFWATVIGLIISSKRPIIMTCNDEDSIPKLENMPPLHAVLRFNPPPFHLGVDYMLLVAACEGHVLQRKAVQGLYESRNFDLRASLMELNFWCQFAVGDVKYGLDWFLSRHPPGSDIDQNRNKIRVVSGDTYQEGMGWLSRDFLQSDMHHLDIEQETLHEAWDFWRLDIGDWQSTLEMEEWANHLRAQSHRRNDNLETLQMYQDYVETMSIADICAGGAYAPDNSVMLDTSVPELSSKAKDEYILAYGIIEAEPLAYRNILGQNLSGFLKSRSRNYLHIDRHVNRNIKVPQELSSPSELDIIRLIRERYATEEPTLTRHDLSLAFDPISEPEKYVWNTSTNLEPSCFDRTISLIVEDVAPYVRSIVAYDTRLQLERKKLSGLLSEGGQRGKRMRTTRSAMSALEGGARSTTRRENYFGPDLKPNLVLKTGGRSWLDVSQETLGANGSQTSSSSGSLEVGSNEG